MTPFLKNVLPISKKVAPKDKLVRQSLRYASCKPEFAPVKRNTVNHVLCKPFSSRDPLYFIVPVDVVNANIKFTPLRSHVHVVKSHFRSLRVCLKSTNNFLCKRSNSSKCLQHSLAHHFLTSSLWSTSIHA